MKFFQKLIEKIEVRPGLKDKIFCNFECNKVERKKTKIMIYWNNLSIKNAYNFFLFNILKRITNNLLNILHSRNSTFHQLYLNNIESQKFIKLYKLSNLIK